MATKIIPHWIDRNLCGAGLTAGAGTRLPYVRSVDCSFLGEASRLRWAIAMLWVAGCESSPVERAPPTSVDQTCTRAHGEKLGVPFVRVCPADLPGVINAPFWIAAAPIGCTGGEHGTIGCPPILALAPDLDVIEARTAQLIEAAFAHRTCALRFGGRLPTTRERAQAQLALGLDTIAITEASDRSRQLRLLAEWTTASACTDPSTVNRSCEPTMSPSRATRTLAWSELRSCRASARPAASALIVEPGDHCPPADPASPPCLLGIRAGDRIDRTFALECRALDANEAIHPEEEVRPRASFRCVVPEGTLAGTIH